MDIKRLTRGAANPEHKGQGSVFLIPREDMPDGLESGLTEKVIIEGLVNIDEQGATIKVDKIYAEKIPNRDNQLEVNIVNNLNHAIEKNKQQ